MEYAKSLRCALRPQTLFASASPVLIVVSLLHQSHSVSFLQLDALALLACALLSQSIGNLSVVYPNFQRALQPRKEEVPDTKIVLNLLTLTQIRCWSYLFYGLQLTFLGVTHVTCDKSVKVTAGMALLVTLCLLYCQRGDKPLPMVGLREVLLAWAIGPVAMGSTAIYLVNEVPWAVVLYTYIVMLFAWAFLLLESARNAPFVRRIGHSEASLALRLGFQLTFQVFLLSIALFYGCLLVTGIAMGHLGNVLLLVSIAKLKNISEDFRLERLNYLPDQFAKLAAFLGFGLIVSILSSFT
uniref:Prenyltransferase n=1 Tax=Peronospora matthiolae TaxID=2874970 RepID=A0AAV1T2S2_9STRA